MPSTKIRTLEGSLRSPAGECVRAKPARTHAPAHLPPRTERPFSWAPNASAISVPAPPHRLLLAEDDGAFRYLLSSALRADGHQVITVSTGVDLLDILTDSMSPNDDCPTFDLVLSDLRMPGWPGLEALARIAGNPAMPPFILFTAFGDQATHRRALEIGALTLLDKPFDLDYLRQLVAQVLN